MPQFQVPQFIEEEAKIIGTLSLRQFFYLAVAGGISFIFFHIFTFSLWFITTVILAAMAVLMAFVKIHGQNMTTILGAALNHFLQPRVYTWQRALPQKTLTLAETEELAERRKSMSIQEKLKSLALNVTTGKIFTQKPTQKERYQTVVFITGERRLAKRVDFTAKNVDLPKNKSTEKYFKI
jgi:hypothetical protein